MTDRKPTYPNRVLLTFEDGTQNYATWQHADTPITAGTPLNKANLLPDALAAKICPGIADPAPADALAGLQKGAGWLYTAALSVTGWSGTGPYIQTVACSPVDGGPAMTADTMTTGLAFDSSPYTQEVIEQLQEVLGILAKGKRSPGEGTMTFTVYEKPEWDIIVYMEGRA